MGEIEALDLSGSRGMWQFSRQLFPAYRRFDGVILEHLCGPTARAAPASLHRQQRYRIAVELRPRGEPSPLSPPRAKKQKKRWPGHWAPTLGTRAVFRSHYLSRICQDHAAGWDFTEIKETDLHLRIVRIFPRTTAGSDRPASMDAGLLPRGRKAPARYWRDIGSKIERMESTADD